VSSSWDVAHSRPGKAQDEAVAEGPARKFLIPDRRVRANGAEPPQASGQMRLHRRPDRAGSLPAQPVSHCRRAAGWPKPHREKSPTLRRAGLRARLSRSDECALHTAKGPRAVRCDRPAQRLRGRSASSASAWARPMRWDSSSDTVSRLKHSNGRPRIVRATARGGGCRRPRFMMPIRDSSISQSAVGEVTMTSDASDNSCPQVACRGQATRSPSETFERIDRSYQGRKIPTTAPLCKLRHLRDLWCTMSTSNTNPGGLS